MPALALLGLLAGCSSPLWLQAELGDLFRVRGHEVELVGGDVLVGEVAWAVSVSLARGASVSDVRRVRVGVGTPGRWTLHGATAMTTAWPDALELERAAWDVELSVLGSSLRQRVDLPAGQRLVRSEPCDARACSYVFERSGTHRDVFTLEGALGDDDQPYGHWFDWLEQHRSVIVTLTLQVQVRPDAGGAPLFVMASVPLVPTGVSVEFRP